MIQKCNYHAVDVAKWIASIFIVGIHASPLKSYSQELNTLFFQVISRVGVPFFFIASSFFFFKSFYSSNSNPKKLVLHYVKRMAQLYVFWFIINLVPTYYYRFYNTNAGFTEDLWHFFMRIPFSSTFKGSWYISASVICIILLYWASKKLSNRSILFISFLCYLFACICGFYKNFFANTPFISFYSVWSDIFFSPYNSWQAGLFWMALGKYFAQNESKLILSKKKRRILYLSLPFLLLLILFEYYTVRSVVSIPATDSFLSLIPFSIVLFISLLNINLPDSNCYKIMRTASTVTYFSQFLFLFFFNVLLKKGLGIYTNSLLTFVLVLMMCYLSTYILVRLRKRYRIFKYAY